MNDEQYKQIATGMNKQIELLTEIKKSVRTIATIMVLAIVLGLLLGFCTAVGF